MLTDSATDPQRAPCMQVWGGNSSQESSFAMPGLDVWVWSETQQRSQDSGGDVHYLSSCASGRITRMLLADICGQGPAFVQLASQLRDLMLCNANAIKQARLVKQIHDRCCASCRHGAFATVLLGTFFAPSKSLTLCNAGHPPPLLYEVDAGEWSVLNQRPAECAERDEAPLGAVELAEHQRFSLRLKPGDMVLSYGNHFAECRDADGQTLGVQGLLQRARRSNPDKPAALLASMAALFGGRRGAGEAHDATLLLCRVNDRPVGWKNNLLAPLRLLRKAHDNTTLQ